MQPPSDDNPERARLMRDLEEGIRRAMRAQNPLKRGRGDEAEAAPYHDTMMAGVYLRAHPRSVELIRHNASRGMSRATMNRIWGQRLVTAVLGSVEIRT